jgi:outer membrane protein assembly factor BamB
MSDIPFDADEMVLALNALEGTVIWSQRLGVNRKFYRNAGGVAVSGDGSRVYAASTAPGPGKTDGFETIAFDADSGGRVWTSTTGPADGVLSDIALADGGSAIVEVGADYPAQSTENIALALDTQTGHLAWQRTFLARGGEFGYLQQVAVSSDGSVAYAAGFSCPDPDCN